MSEWQPINTAPKDGTKVILWLDDEGFAVTGSWRTINAGSTDAEWTGFWIWEMDQGADCWHDVKYWHPLPSPPPTP